MVFELIEELSLDQGHSQLYLWFLGTLMYIFNRVNLVHRCGSIDFE